MKRTLIALLLVVALVVTVSVFAVSADAPTQLTSTLTTDAETGVTTGYCPHCDQTVTWTAYDNSKGHFNDTNYTKGTYHLYLAADVPTTNTAGFMAPSSNVTIHLNGNTLNMKAYSSCFQGGASTVINVLDKPDGAGKVLKLTLLEPQTSGERNIPSSAS